MTRRKAIVVGCVLLVLAGISRARTAVWRTEGALWADALQHAHQKPRAHLNYGRTREWVGAPLEATLHYQLALAYAQDPRRGVLERRFITAAAQNNQAHVLMTEKPDEAIYLLQANVREFPWFAPSYYQLAMAWCQQSKYREASEAMLEAVRWDHDLPRMQCAPITIH